MHPTPEKRRSKGGRTSGTPPPGLPAIETMLPLMLTQVNRGQISLKRLVVVASENPAKAFNFYPRKGVIQVGSDADLVIIDLGLEKIVKGSELHAKTNWTPLEEWQVKGVPLVTILRGEVIIDEDEIVASPGYGDFIQASACAGV